MTDTRDMHWTWHRPEVPGWYWWRWNGSATIVYFALFTNTVYWLSGERQRLAYVTGRWYGPLTPPEGEFETMDIQFSNGG